MALAIVSEEPLAVDGILRPQDELIQTTSLADALRQLAASAHSRKVVVSAAALDLEAIPSGMQAVQANPDNPLRTVIALRNQYRLQFETSSPSASFEIVLHQPAGLPPLQPNWD